MSELNNQKGKNACKTQCNKGLLIFLLLFFICSATILIPSINTNVSSSIQMINSQNSKITQNSSQFSTIFDTLKYERSIHILAMLLAGFGFLMVFIRKHGYSSITATFLAVSIAIPLYVIIKSFGGAGFAKTTISIDTLIFAEFAAASLLIAIGAPLGKLKMDQYVIMGLLFVPVYILNEWFILDSGMFKGFYR